MRRRSRRGVTAALLATFAIIGGSLPFGADGVNAADQLPTTTALSATASQVGAFDPIHLLAIVRETPADGGEVTLYRNSIRVMARQLSPNGAANFALLAGLPPGTHRFDAVFEGTAGSAPSTSETVDIEVVEDRATTSITLVSDNSPSLRGTPARLTVTMSPDPGPGAITLRTADANRVNLASVANAAGGDTAIAFTPLSRASYDYRLEACFEGNTEFLGGCSQPITHSTWGYSTTTTLELVPSAIYRDEPFAIRVTVAPPPETEVNLRVGKDAGSGWYVGIDPVTGTGEVTIVPFIHRNALVGAGPFPFIAFYPGTIQTDPSQSTTHQLTINLDATATTVTVEPGVIQVGTTSLISVAVEPPPMALPIVGVTIDHPTLADWTAAVPLDADGRGNVAFDSTTWPAGAFAVTATFGGTDRLALSTASSSITILPTGTPSDTTPPSGSLAIDGADAYTATTAVTLATAATDGGSGLSQVALSNDGVTWTTRPYAATQAWTLPATEGMSTVHAKWQDVAGNWSTVATDTIILDTVAPSTTAPRRGFAAGSSIANGAIALRVPWSGSDATSGIAHYELEQRTDGGGWTSISTALTVASDTVPLVTEHQYAFRVRAIDVAGNIGAWQTGDTFRVSRYSEGNARISYAGRWTTARSSAYWGGVAKRAVTSGARASLTFTGRSIAWVTRTGPDRGRAEVLVGGKRVAIVDLYAPGPQNQRVAWVGSWSSAVARTITIRVLGTTGRPRVDLDAFVTID